MWQLIRPGLVAHLLLPSRSPVSLLYLYLNFPVFGFDVTAWVSSGWMARWLGFPWVPPMPGTVPGTGPELGENPGNLVFLFNYVMFNFVICLFSFLASQFLLLSVYLFLSKQILVMLET